MTALRFQTGGGGERDIRHPRPPFGGRKKRKATKEEWIEEQCKNVEMGMMSGNSKEAYNTLKALTKTQQRKSAVFEDSSGNILMESTDVLNQWTEYCSGLCNHELYPDTSLPHSSWLVDTLSPVNRKGLHQG